jgi:hypothetical protein
MAGSPYDTVIRLSVVDGVGPVLATLAARCMGVDRSFGKLNDTIKKTLAGGALIFGGSEVLKGMWELAKGSKELLNQQEQLSRAGMSHLEVLNLTADAYNKIAKAVPTAQASEILRTAREMRAIAGPAASMAKLER